MVPGERRMGWDGMGFPVLRKRCFCAGVSKTGKQEGLGGMAGAAEAARGPYWRWKVGGWEKKREA